jgi:glycerol-1-phosphate dehydrogenase [NAD(P)+]
MSETRTPPFGQPFTPVKVPTDLDGLLGFFAPCGCGITHSVETRRVSLRRGAVEDVTDFVRDIGQHLSVAVIADAVTAELAGRRVAALLESAGHRDRLVVVPDGAGGRPHADEARLRLVEAALEGVDAAVAVGAGTINDLTKLASYHRKIPYAVVATAPSMNGYTSAIAAIMMRGVKRTIPCHQPYAVAADLDILTKAPLELCQAGLGDLESKPTASADFRLSNLLLGTYFCTVPEQVVLAAEQQAADLAEGLRHRDPSAVEALTRALLLSGISMKLAGSSGPASGGEHLISHYWDMTAARDGRVEGRHGAQVGVATIVTATLYDHLRRRSGQDLDIDAAMASRPDPEKARAAIRARHGEFADEVLAEWSAKQPAPEALRERLERVKAYWSELWRHLGGMLVPPARIREVLRAAGAPLTVAGLGLTNAHLKEAYTAAPEIRGRYTVLDFAQDLGVFEPQKERVLAASGCLEG